MGALWHCFMARDVDRRVKYWVYTAGPLNTLLWGCESWHLKEYNLKKLHSFHHYACRRILGISWTQMREDRITNEEVRWRFENIPVDTFIVRRTSRFVGKVCRALYNSIPKKLLGAWIYCAPEKLEDHKTCATIISSQQSRLA